MIDVDIRLKYMGNSVCAEIVLKSKFVYTGNHNSLLTSDLKTAVFCKIIYDYYKITC